MLTDITLEVEDISGSFDRLNFSALAIPSRLFAKAALREIDPIITAFSLAPRPFKVQMPFANRGGVITELGEHSRQIISLRDKVQ